MLNVFSAEFISIFLIMSCMLSVIYYDFLYYNIPNAIPLAILFIYCFHLFISGFSLSFYPHIVLIILLIALFTCLFYFNIIGGGDAKLFIVLTPWMMEVNIKYFFFYTSIAGLLLAILYYPKSFLPYISKVRWTIIQAFNPGFSKTTFKKLGYLPPGKNREPRVGVPYGIAIACGVAAAFMKRGF